MSGVPLSFIDVNVGIVAPGTNSTSHPYPSSRMILSTFAINSADAQFCSAITNFPQAFAKEVMPNAKSAENRIVFNFFIISPLVNFRFNTTKYQ